MFTFWDKNGIKIWARKNMSYIYIFSLSVKIKCTHETIYTLDYDDDGTKMEEAGKKHFFLVCGKR